jgi:hypothetical protein
MTQVTWLIQANLIDSSQTNAVSQAALKAKCNVDGKVIDGSLKVIEFNCFNSSGFYAHDIDKVIGAVSEHVRSM